MLPATTGEARREPAASRPGPITAPTWSARSRTRTRWCATRSCPGDPEGSIALSGTQATTPYNGSDWYRLDQVIDDFLSYSGGNQWDFHRSFAKPGARIGFWTGYGRRGAAVRHEIWSAALNGVLHPEPVLEPLGRSTPTSRSRSPGATWARSFQALRFEGVGKLLMESRARGRRHRDPLLDALRARGGHPRAALRDEGRRRGRRPGFPANRDGWARMLTDLGLSYDFVAAPQIEAGALDPRRIAGPRAAPVAGGLDRGGARRSSASRARAES